MSLGISRNDQFQTIHLGGDLVIYSILYWISSTTLWYSTIDMILMIFDFFQDGTWRCRVPRRYCLAGFELQWHHIYQRWHPRISGLENDLSTREQNPQICRYPETAAVAKSLQLDSAWESNWELSQLQVHICVRLCPETAALRHIGQVQTTPLHSVPKFKESYKRGSKIKLYLVLCSMVWWIITKKKIENLQTGFGEN